jgi:3-hydroxyacyl-[acyl-carrier-protein] dehydratase
VNSFRFIDTISDLKKDAALSASFTLTGEEEFLKDHFSGFPVMPGVLLLESARQAASLLSAYSSGFETPFFRLVRAEDVRFGHFVRPGASLAIRVTRAGSEGGASVFDARIDVSGEGSGKALSARLFLAPVDFSEDQKKAASDGARSLFGRLAAPARIA